MLMAFHQPNYLPNLSFFYKMAQADLFIITTNVQFMRREWQSRAKFAAADGRDLMITVPVLGSNRQMIREAQINNHEKWRQKHARTLTNLYQRHVDPAIVTAIQDVYDTETDRLADLNFRFIGLIRDLLGIRTQTVFDEEVTGHKHELLINICEKYQVNEYLSGLGGKSYMDEEFVAKLQKHNITHRFVDRDITNEYPYSSLHYILSEGVDKARRIIEVAQ